MAVATSFDESNAVLDTPKDMTPEQVTPLSALVAKVDGVPQIISCWKLTKEELEEVNRTGRVWLGIIGTGMPPVYISGIKPFGEKVNG